MRGLNGVAIAASPMEPNISSWVQASAGHVQSRHTVPGPESVARTGALQEHMHGDEGPADVVYDRPETLHSKRALECNATNDRSLPLSHNM